MALPQRVPKSDIFRNLKEARKADIPWREGKLYSYVYDGGKELEEVAKAAYMEFLQYLTENGLDPSAFPSLLRFENDLVCWMRKHLNGDDSVVGSFTSGGTESIILAVKAARDHFFHHHPDIKAAAEMIVPVTAHAAFHKAAAYLGMRAVVVPVHPETFRADPAAIRAAITPRTALLVVSAPSYAHGVVDPVEEVAALARECGILCHVDACIGGFLLPYFRRLGARAPAFDFAVPGVTSLSVDLHKYALCPKGASLVLYRDESIRLFQFFACSSWTGYTMLNSTMQSSKSGGPVAAAWAVLQFIGDEGYMQYAKALLEAKERLLDGIAAVPGLRVLGRPEMSLIAFTSDDISVFSLADEMKALGFHVQVQFRRGASPENIHVSLQPSNLPHLPSFLSALRSSVAAVRASETGVQAPKEIAAALTKQLRSASAEEVRAIMKSMIASDESSGDTGHLPAKMAPINALLNELPADVQEKVLRVFLGQLLTPPSRL